MALELTEEQVKAGWTVQRLGSITTKIGSGATPRGGKSVYIDDGAALVRSQNVYDHELIFEGIARIDEDAEKQLRSVKVQGCDILLNITGDSIARCAYMKPAVEDAYVNQHVCIVRVDPAKADYLYIQKYLAGSLGKKRLLDMSDGATRKALTKKALEEFEIALPPREEQKRVAEILGSLDDKIEANKSVIALSLKIAQGLHAFEKNDDHESMILEELFADFVGGDWGKEQEEDNLFPVYAIRGADIPSLQRGESGSLPLRFIKESSLKRRALKAGDVVVEGSGGSPTQCTGRPVLVTQELLNAYEHPVVATNFCKIIKPVKQSYGLSIYLTILNAWEQGELWQYETGTTGIKNLNFSLFASQKKIIISDVARPYVDSVSRFGAENTSLEETRDLLIRKLIK